MPLNKFKKEEKWGLKNASGKIIIEPKYDSIYITEDMVVTSHYVYDDEEDCNNQILLSHDLSGDFITNLSIELENQGIDRILEFDQLKDNIFSFQYSNWDSMELSGVFNQSGQIIIEPEYDVVELISEYLMLCFHGEHYEEYDILGNKNYGNKLYDIYGDKLEDNSIKDYEELKNGDFEFITTANRKFITDKYGQIKK